MLGPSLLLERSNLVLQLKLEMAVEGLHWMALQCVEHGLDAYLTKLVSERQAVEFIIHE